MKSIYFICGINPLIKNQKLFNSKSGNLIIIENKNLKPFLGNYNNKSKYFFLSNFKIIKIFQLFLIIVIVKIKKYDLNFFHIAYWPSFDYLINLFRINGTQILYIFEDWSGKNKINKKVKDIFKIKNLSFLRKLRFFILRNTIYKNHELFFRKSFSHIKDDVIIFANCKFHKGITSKLVYRNNIVKSRKKNIYKIFKKKSKKKILLLPTKKYPEKFRITKKLFYYIVKILIKTNHKIYFKDHPTHGSGLDFEQFSKVKKINIIKNTTLIENSKLRFDIVIGFDSTGLIHYDEKAISLIKFYGNSRYLDQKKYFDNNGGTLINYPKNYTEIKKFLKP